MKFIASFVATLSLLAGASFAADSGSVLAELNFARTNPQAYARVIAQSAPAGDRDAEEAIRFLEKASPLQPLSPSTGLSQGAGLHVASQGPTGGFGHGSSPFSRMDKFGKRTGAAGENISYGKSDARGVVCQLIIDKGVSSRGHRKNIFNRAYAVAGVASGSHAKFGSMCVIDFAAKYVERGTVASL